MPNSSDFHVSVFHSFAGQKGIGHKGTDIETLMKICYPYAGPSRGSAGPGVMSSYKAFRMFLREA